jgi:tetratricopeptide (TPR) repeat protein
MNNEKNISLNEFFKCYDKIKLKLYKSWGLYYLSDILLKVNDQYISEAGDWIENAIEAHKEYGMMWHLARDYTLYADVFKRKGDLKKSIEHMSKALEIFKECGADGWVEKYQKDLAEL